MAPYRGAADAFRRAQCGELAATVGGGMCGPGPSSIVASAALQLAMSRYLSDRGQATGDPKLLLSASRLADASRQNLLAAHELCAREAISREANRKADVSRQPWLMADDPETKPASPLASSGASNQTAPESAEKDPT